MKQFILSILLISGIAQASADDGIRSFDLDTSTRYVRGRFDLETEGRALLTIPTRPTKPKSQAVLMYEGRPRPVEEAVLVSGRDGRTKVEDTEKFPWCLHGQMSMEFGGSTYGGSGILIGPHHFLTAAHNIYKFDRLEQAGSIRIRLGLNDDVATFGEVTGTKVYLYDRWMRFGDQEYDLALVILNQSVGHETGWAGLLCLQDKELMEHRVHVTGYPGDKGLKTLWTMEDTISRVEGGKLHYLIDTYKGQSGGAIWIKKWSMPYVLGTHAYGGSLTDGGNFGVRLNERKIQDVVGWIGNTLVIDASAAAGGGGSVSASGSIPAPLRAYPPIASGHEAEYDRFLSGILTYKPNKDNDRGRVDIPIRSLANPLEGTFDLSAFGDTSRYISIHTGYKKAKIPANKDKVEIWLTPKFLVEANLGSWYWPGDARWMKNVLDGWEAPYGIVWTGGRSDVKSDNFDYLLKGEVLLNKDKNLYEKAIFSGSHDIYVALKVVDLKSSLPLLLYFFRF